MTSLRGGCRGEATPGEKTMDEVEGERDEGKRVVSETWRERERRERRRDLDNFFWRRKKEMFPIGLGVTIAK